MGTGGRASLIDWFVRLMALVPLAITQPTDNAPGLAKLTVSSPVED